MVRIERAMLSPITSASTAATASVTAPTTGATVSAKSAKYLPPIPNPGKILCIGLNYRKHAEETNNPIPPYPVVFTRFNNTLLPHNGKMPMPSHSKQLDWEAELTIVIGKKCRNVPKNKALGVIAGYACFNDGSVRDWQRKSGGQFTLGKNFDGTGGFGPDIVTPDELPKGAAPLRIMTRVNGVTMQDSNTDDLIFDVPTLVHELSKFMTLEPGDIIITGTPSGVAAGPQAAALAEGRRHGRDRDREDRRAAPHRRQGRLSPLGGRRGRCPGGQPTTAPGP